jgi:protein O-GlcNAc transferase
MPTSSDYERRASALIAAGDRAGAESVYRDAIRKFPHDAQARFGLAMMLKDERHPAEARKLFLAGLKRVKSQPMLTALGFVERRLGLAAEAEATLRRSLALDPRDSYAMVQLGYLIREERPAEAVELYRAALRIEPTIPYLHREMGWALCGCKRWRAAEPFMRKAIRRDPRDCWAYSGLGMVLAVRERWEDAYAADLRAAELEPSYGPLWAHVAKDCVAAGREPEAERHFAHALFLGWGTPTIHKEYGQYLMWKGRLSEARVHLTEARKRSRNPSPYTLRALRRLDELERERKKAR